MTIGFKVRSFIKEIAPSQVMYALGKAYSRTKLPRAAYSNKESSAAWQEFAATERMNRVDLERLQWERFQKILCFAFEHVPYYCETMRERGITPDDIGSYEELVKLPIVEKEDVKRNPGRFTSDTSVPDAHWAQTTGSSGAPTQILISPRHLAIRNAIVWRYRKLAGFDRDEPHVLIVRKSFPDDAAAADFHGRYSITRNYYCFASTNMMPSVMQKYVDIIRRFRPRFIEGYSSAVYALATYILEHGLDVRVPVIITRTDQLYPKYSKAIALAFQTQNVYNFYGNVEQVASGSDCYLHQGKHVNMEACLIETLDEHGKQVLEEPGEVVGTNLINKAMVLIRYRLGDRITLSKEKCACGRESYLIKNLFGRTDDLLSLANGRRMAGASLWLCGKNLFGIREYQLVQRSQSHIIVNLSKYPDCPQSEEQQLMSNLREHLGEDIELEVVHYDLVPRINGKFKFIVKEPS